MTRRRQIVGGYAWNRQMRRAHQANTRARQALADILDHVAQSQQISALVVSQLLAEAVLAISESQAALNELDEIAGAGEGD